MEVIILRLPILEYLPNLPHEDLVPASSNTPWLKAEVSIFHYQIQNICFVLSNISGLQDKNYIQWVVLQRQQEWEALDRIIFVSFEWKLYWRPFTALNVSSNTWHIHEFICRWNRAINVMINRVYIWSIMPKHGAIHESNWARESIRIMEGK